MSAKSQKTCFVTIGATASFSGLIKAVLTPVFHKALQSQQYTILLLQYGADGQTWYEQCLQQLTAEDLLRLEVSGFALDTAGLGRYMRQAKGIDTKDAAEGVVISHAGT